MKAERKTAIDRTQLRALLRAYLQMSSRGASLLRARGKPTTLAFVLALYAFLGLMIGLVALAHPGVLLYSLGLHGVTFFTVGMAAVIESNDVLFDPREDEILLHRPVPAATLLAAKGLALVGFALMIAGCLNFFPTFFLLAAEGAAPWIPLVHVFSTVLLVLFVCGGVVCSYGLILRVFGRERFEGLAVFAQVGLTLFFVGGFQILPHLVERMDREQLGNLARILLPAPPAWFAAMDASLGTLPGSGMRDTGMLVAAGAGVVGTLLLAWIGVGKLSAGYGEMASVRGTVPIAGAKASSSGAVPAATAGWRSRNPLLRAWLRDPIEWSAFRMTKAYLRRDRDVKLRIYSSMSMFVVLMVLSLLDPRHGRRDTLPLLMFAMAGTVPLTMMETIRMSSHHAAAEIFHSAPLASAAPLFHGVRKASILFVQLPVACLGLLTLILRARSPLESLEMTLPIAIVIPTLSLVPGVFGDYLPLSMAPRRGRQSSQNVGVILGTILLVGILFGLAIAAQKLGVLWILVGVELVVVVVVHRLLLARIRNRRMRRFEPASE